MLGLIQQLDPDRLAGHQPIGLPESCQILADPVRTWLVLLTGERAVVVSSAMAHLSVHDRSQLLLLPEAVDDDVGPDNPVRFIEAFVDELDLGAAGFARVVPKATGRPGYDPADLLKLHIYGYLNRVRSSRSWRPRRTATSR